jgi:uncharacterized protein YcfL
MKKFFLALFIFLLVFGCSSNWEKRPAPAYKPYATAQGVR